MPMDSLKDDANNIHSDGSVKKRFLKLLKANVLLILLILSLVLGIGIGAAVRSRDEPLTKRELMYFKFPGELLMRLLKMLIIPLIVSTLISGMASLNPKTCGRIGGRAVVYYMTTTLIAVLIGILLVMTIKPGNNVDNLTNYGKKPPPANTADSFLDLIRNIFPDNIIESAFLQTKTTQILISETFDNATNETQVKYDFAVRKESGMNVLGLVVFSIIIGVILSRMGDRAKPIRDLTECLGCAILHYVTLIIWYSPIGIMFLVASEIIKMNDPIQDLKAVGMYIVTVLIGLCIHALIILPGIYALICRKNPLVFMSGVGQALATALGTASSAATLPVTYKCLEEKIGVSKQVTRFVLPVGATINMDGTALYEAVAAIFIAQLNNMHLTAGKVVAVSITATAASIGAAAIPQAGLVTMIIVLTAIGLPSDDIAKIVAVDWLLDRFRTTVNVWGDSIGAAVVEKLSEKDLENEDFEKENDGYPDIQITRC